MDQDFNKYITLKNLSKNSLIHEIYQYSKIIDKTSETYKIDTKSYYKDLYEKSSKNYSFLLNNIEANELYFNYQKQKKSNSLFLLLSKLVKDTEKAQTEFEKIKSPSFSGLTKYFQDIVKKNKSSKVYYRYNSNCDITNCLSLEPFSLSDISTLGSLSIHYDLANWY
ncbi:18928_t:CDS:1 [Gigaspora margarita]|uniref:18928_t:CDS:1 n=1 Tax=Gigaspora margarita TaxID=4874 RepID=A0ABN7W2B6_GIGMA|nr:18928_t:CDS:1 [Gigaspora margarita]